MGGVTVLYGDKGYLFHKGSNIAKKNRCVVQKGLRDSQHYGCTAAHKENNAHNTHKKPRGNKTDAMPLSESSRGSQPGPNLQDQKIQIQKIQEQHTIQCEMMRWMVKNLWC